MEDALTLAQKVSTISAPILMALIILGGYWEIWVWGRQFREAKAELKARLDAMEQERDEWKDMALRTVGIAESTTETLTTVAKRRPAS